MWLTNHSLNIFISFKLKTKLKIPTAHSLKSTVCTNRVTHAPSKNKYINSSMCVEQCALGHS